MIERGVDKIVEQEVVERFLKYVRVWTTSDPGSPSKPTTQRQNELLQILRDELLKLGLSDVCFDTKGFVYATLPGDDERFVPFGLMAHVDTSPDQSGEGVNPRLHPQYDGSPIQYPDDKTLLLSAEDSHQLKDFIGSTIITAGGKTLLGADDKAGVAEIMTALSIFTQFPSLPHGRIVVCFTTDEEVGRGVDGIDTTCLPPHLYTIDGGYPGEFEVECFDAIGVTLTFYGRGVHPGYSFGKMVNAVRAASIFVSRLPHQERPETTKDRDGFFHVSNVDGNNEVAKVSMLLRDFEHASNLDRLSVVKELAQNLEEENPGLKVEVASLHQYENMRDVLQQHPEVSARAERAISDTGLNIIKKPIRGGTDGSRLTAMGFPTPNIFTGGMLAHSRKEWIAVRSMCQAVQTILNLARHHERNHF
jgi:tripeptide aminopeptidase